MAKPMRVLSVDGGGIRGVIPASVLTEIERIVQDREGPDARLVDFVDLVAGTSTGGIVVGLLVLPTGDGPGGSDRFAIRTARDILDFYLGKGPVLFERTVWDRIRRFGALFDERYGSEGFLRVLDETVGATRDVMLSELARPTVITTYNATVGSPYFFKQHRALEPGGRDFTLHDVARATAAAPTYFETVDVRSVDGDELGACVDGGVFANNPTMCAYAEARGHFGYGAADMAILSLGTGASLQSYTYGQMRNWGVTRWLKPLIDMMMAGSERATDYQVRQIFESLGPDADAQYLRLQADLGDEPDSVAQMDNTDPADLRRLAAIGREVVDRQREDIERFVDTQLLGPVEPATTLGASPGEEGP